MTKKSNTAFCIILSFKEMCNGLHVFIVLAHLKLTKEVWYDFSRQKKSTRILLF